MSEVRIVKRDMAWDLTVQGSTVQIRILSSGQGLAPEELLRLAVERICGRE